MSERVVLFVNGGNALLLKDVERDISGRIIAGFVVNGGWNYRQVGNEVQAKNGRVIVTRWPQYAHEEQEVAVPKEERGDYNAIINWAQQQLS